LRVQQEFDPALIRCVGYRKPRRLQRRQGFARGIGLLSMDAIFAQPPSGRCAASRSFMATCVASGLVPAHARPISRQLRSSLTSGLARASRDAGSAMELDPFAGHILVFRGRRGD
jgi:hypothetical protein